ncbi:MAG TPA: type II secretion system secretin GspD [Bacteriovoracaceae bacterium]|nr:type II secretion system secretin GspD [Bacteriovoracaceae bacterium]
MKTRCQSKRVVKYLILAGILLAKHEAHAQFNKYRSQTRFNPDNAAAPQRPQPEGAASDVNAMSAEDAAAALNAAEDVEAQTTPPLPGADAAPGRTGRAKNNSNAGNASPANNAASDAAFEGDADDDANQETFGDRPADTAPPKNSKYVNLNPETAFGPEIVESFDFPDTDIMEITKHMQKLTGINLILDKDVKGKVSIIAPTPITVGDAWKAYLAALNMAGYSLIKTGAFYKVINARDIRYTPTKIYTGNYTPDTENYVMRVISLKHVSAAEIARNFRPFMSRYGRIIDIKQTNTIIIADTGSNINRLAKMVKFLDVTGHEEALQIVKMKHSSAQEIAKLLDNILKGGGSAAGGRPGSATPRFTGGGSSSESTSVISRIIAEPRTNSIIAMANAEGGKQLRELIDKLDVKLNSSGSNRVHVYYLNYGDSEDLSKTLSSIVTGNTAKDAGGAGGASRFSALGGGQSDNPIFSAEVKITSDKNNNALVVTASPTDWLTLRDVIGRLDIPRDQVYVEGLILEAKVNKNRSFGVEYAGAYGQGAVQRTGFTGSKSDILSLITTGVPASLGGFFAGFGLGPKKELDITGPTGTSIGKRKVNAISGFIKAIASHESTNILATPQILALDNTEATFEVGDTVPVRNSTITTGVQNFSTTQQEAKLSLKITPQINKVTRFVKLKITQKIDDFGSGDPNAGIGLPTTTRSAITEVMVRDRDTIAMGGLLRDREQVTNTKIPVLGDIPVLGWLFKNKSKTLEKVNLLFFMTPKILAPYNKTASSNTKDVLERRAAGMKEMFEEDELDPNIKVSDTLTSKLNQQINGPLYDLTDADHYKNLNNEARQRQDPNEAQPASAPETPSANPPPSTTPEELDIPDYQEIKKSVQ